MGEDVSTRERRKTQRVRWAVMVQMEWKQDQVTAYTTDISVNGFFAETRKDIPLKTKLEIKFQVEGADGGIAVEATGVVVRRHSPEEAAAAGIMPGVGVRFKRIRKNDKAFRRSVDTKLGRVDPPRNERRSEQRLPVGMPLWWGTEDPPKREGRLADVSARGALCVVQDDLPETGARIYLSFKLPHKGVIKDVKAMARVMRVERVDGCSTMGLKIEFSSVGDDLLPLLRERLPKIKEEETGFMSMGMGEAARAIRDNIPRIRIGDKYHVFRWKWVLGWFGVAVLIYALLFFAIGEGIFR